MNLAEFPEQNLIIAKDQPQYRPMPCYWDRNTGEVTCCWQLTWRERIRLLFTGKLWHTILTFNQPMQPQLLEVSKPPLAIYVARTS